MAQITLIATKLGFYAGQRIRPGQSFQFDVGNSKEPKLPKWAVEDKAVAQARIADDKRRAEQAVDTRSLATQAASKKKTQAIADGNPSSEGAIA